MNTFMCEDPGHQIIGNIEPCCGIEKIKKCIQCGVTMKNSYAGVPICEEAVCPNYLLLQVGVEMAKQN